MYEIIIENKVKKQIESIDKNHSLKIIESIENLKSNPRPRGCAKLEVFEGYRIRVGDFRVLYTISDKNKIITIYKVSKRDKAYNK